MTLDSSAGLFAAAMVHVVVVVVVEAEERAL